jgi:hypothetical protein
MSKDGDQEMIRVFIRIGGFLFFSFGIAALLFRIIQFGILGDPPLEILVLTDEFLFLQGVPSFIVAIFFLVGATALYMRQIQELGRIGLVIYFISFSMLVLSSGAMWTYAFTAPQLAVEAPQLLTSPSSRIVRSVIASLALGQIGWLLLVLVSFRSRKIPKWALWVSFSSILLVIIMTPFTQTQFLRLFYNVLLGAGPLAIGYVLWRDSEKNL